MGFSSVECGEPRPKGHRRKVLVLTKFGMFIKEAGQEGREAKKKKEAGKHILFNISEELQNSGVGSGRENTF